MKTHITTKENPIWKEGLSVKFTGGTFVHEPYYDKKENILRVHDAELDFYIHNKKWIKEVEKPEFTKSDVLEIVGDWLKTERNIPFDQYFDNRIENRGK